MDQSEGKTANSFKSLCTRKRHNDGVKLVMDDGVNWLLIRGIDSDAVHDAMVSVWRERAQAKPAEDEEKPSREFKVMEEPRVLAAMVGGWSYDEPFTAEAVDELIADAPLSLKDSIANESCTRARFLASDANSSSSSQSTSSG